MDLTGQSLGRYRLESLVGQGGMAFVYRATDAALGRTVAVKVVLPGTSSDHAFGERFVREAKLVAALQHPGILPVYDTGMENGQAYLVLPFLPGGTLRERMPGRPLPLSQVVEWMRQLAGALDAAHDAGVLHRDVKPSNVLVGADGRLVLSDFGIAKMLESATHLTATGHVVGTPVYMAPEQAQGLAATPASDRYALAVIAFELLAGQPPFRGESALSLMHQHVSNPAPLLSSVVAGLPAGIDAVLAAGLAKDPALRPPTAVAFAEALAAFVPTGAHPASGTALTTPWLAATTGALTIPTLLPDAGRPRVREVATPPPTMTNARTFAAPAPFFAAERSREGRAAALLAIGSLAVGGLALVTISLVRRPEPRDSGVPLVVASTLVAERATPAAPRRDEAPAGVPPAHAAPATAATAAAAATPAPERRTTAVPVRAAAAEAPAPEAVDARETLAEPGRRQVMERLDPSRHGGRRPARADFERVRADALTVLGKSPRKPDALFLSAWADGAIAYLDGRDDEAGRLLLGALRDSRKAGAREVRQVGLLLLTPRGALAPPTGWQLALAYLDARREGERLVNEALASDPGDGRALVGRAALRRLDGRHAEAISDALRAWDAIRSTAAGLAAAELLADEYERTGKPEEARAWRENAAETAPAIRLLRRRLREG